LRQIADNTVQKFSIAFSVTSQFALIYRIIYLVDTNAIIIFARANERDCASEKSSERIADVSRGYFLVVDEGDHRRQVCQAWKVACRFLRDRAVTSLRLRKHRLTQNHRPVCSFSSAKT